jgi:hypothetical protein
MIITAAWALKEHYSASPPRKEYIQDAVTEIWKSNVASVEQRYPSERRTRALHGSSDDSMIWWGPAAFAEDPVTDGLVLAALELNPLVAHMVARCVDYQSCDFDGYEKTRGYDLIKKAIDSTAYRAASAHCEAAGYRGWPAIELVDSGAILLSMGARP